MDPGLVLTDLGKAGAAHLGFPPEACLTVDASCGAMFKVFADSTKEKHGGKMVGFDGEIKGF